MGHGLHSEPGKTFVEIYSAAGLFNSESVEELIEITSCFLIDYLGYIFIRSVQQLSKCVCREVHGAKIGVTIHCMHDSFHKGVLVFLGKRASGVFFCLVRKSVDRQIQHFSVKCVKKSKNPGTNPRFPQ